MAAAFRSAVLWQITVGFMLGTLGTLAARDADAEGPPAHHGAAQPLRLAP